MEKKFIGYRKKNKEEIKELWKKAYFTFDTNTLLSLYRYSQNTRTSLIDLITKLEQRVFLTNHVAYEFSKNRLENINDIIRNNKDFLKELDKIKNNIISSNSSPYLSNNLTTKFTGIIDEINSEVNEKISLYEKYFNSDILYELLNIVFKDKILEGFGSTKISEIAKEGDIRYSKKIPPGFADAKKEDNKYGDLIIWKEIIEFSKKHNVPVIFITDDNKEDWIWKLKDGKIIGARPELIQEFLTETNNNFHIYNSNRFIEIGSEYFDKEVTKETIEEILKVNNETRLSEYFEYLKALQIEELENRLKILSPKEADFLRLNLGSNGKIPLSTKEISEVFDIELQEAIRLRSQAIRKLRDSHKI
ncbi:hypothetical protein EG338_00600 [Kaistella haifensis]|nr:hypothetical protein EG338_00600 [Kaistella haifensis]